MLAQAPTLEIWYYRPYYLGMPSILLLGLIVIQMGHVELGKSDDQNNSIMIPMKTPKVISRFTNQIYRKASSQYTMASGALSLKSSSPGFGFRLFSRHFPTGREKKARWILLMQLNDSKTLGFWTSPP